MGRILLVLRLAVRDLRRRRAEAALLLIAVLAATTTLTLGLVLRDAAGDPYQSTRAATVGPDVVAGSGRAAGLARLAGLATASGVTEHSGPYPVIAGKLAAPGRTSDAQIVGRDTTVAAVDQPKVTRGRWVSGGGAVLEAAFADWLDVGVGDAVTLGGRSFEVVGVAVTAAMPPYPGASCIVSAGCVHGAVPDGRDLPAGLLRNPGLVWLTQADVRSLAPAPDSLSHVLNLKLADPREAQAFVERNGGEHGGAVTMQTWQSILAEATDLAKDSQILLLIGAWLLGLLAVATLAVLVGGRMADQSRRVGLLKAVGGTPGLVAAVLLAEYLLVAVVAAAGGLTIGALSAPSLTESSAGLVGGAGTASLTWPTIAVVTAVALGVAIVVTAVPAVRAARSSTVGALADAARPPRRTGWLISLSARLPVPLLLAVRVAARRPRRVALGVAGIAVTVSGIHVLLVLDAFLGGQTGTGAYTDAQVAVLRHVLLLWTVILLCLAAVNAVVITWATVLDNRHVSALTRALGATPRDVTVALASAQVLPAFLGAVMGAVPGGWALLAAISTITGGDGDKATPPGPWQQSGLVLVTVLVVATLTAVPAHLGGRRPVTAAL
ncbi:ABC transporter permease [Nonomuraea rhodomycinica]|uniref:FtsX-like permease family protein n=1 Tax=Nonomuraea rhodomycinica TaxID=1712872 RepID=A0A7Y6II26_9ACTN|nr:FtsX-like permease family protein [Nonomuraea rhodomycinica]NUW38532.1 FtsX-like permease family protein [Nonomuraea rhodomycinica]